MARTPTPIQENAVVVMRGAAGPRGRGASYLSIKLIHKETGLQVSGEIEGDWSELEFKAQEDELRRRLWRQLEEHVAGNLNDPSGDRPIEGH